jgi:hypothetical protein
VGGAGAADRGVPPEGQDAAAELRRTVEAIFWRHQNGAKWRSVPAELAPRGAGRMIGAADHGGGRRSSSSAGRGSGPGAPARGGPGAPCRARRGVPRRHQRPGAPESGGRGQKGGSRAGRDVREALGRSRGGHGREACVSDRRRLGAGRRLRPGFRPSPRAASRAGPAGPAAARAARRCRHRGVVGDRCEAARRISSDASREPIRSRGARPAVPTRRNEAAVACPGCIHNNRSGATLPTGRAAVGAAEGVARRRDPPREDSRQLPGRALPWRRRPLAQALAGPSLLHCRN